MIEVTDTSKVALARFVRLQWEPIQHGHVLLYPEGLVRLNASAAEILKRGDGDTSLGQIIAELEGVYRAQGVAQSVRQFIGLALDRRWVKVRP